MMRSVAIAAGLGGALVLTGCALNERMLELTGRMEQVKSRLQSDHAGFRAAASDADLRRSAQMVDRPWVTGKIQPLARDVTLPLALRADVATTLLFADGPLGLSDIAQRITVATNIPVQVRPEALLPSEAFMPRLAAQNGVTTGALKSQDKVYLSGQSEPLARILDRVAAALGVSWAYRHGRIDFYRTETRVFNIQALTLDARAEASLGLRSDTGAQGGFTSSSQTSLSTSGQDVFEVVRTRIEPFLSRSGVLAAQPGASASIVVTDTPDVLDRIATYIEHENKVMTRRVRLIFEEITLTAQDDAQAGLDWDLIFSSARVAAMASMGGAGLVEAGIATLGMTQGPFSGSEAMVAALSQVGKVIRRSSIPVLTLNRRPVTHAVRTTFSYIDKVDTTAFSDGAGVALPSVSVSQKEETVGSLLTLVPDAQDDGRILLSMAYDSTIAQPIKTVMLGSRNNPLQIQQISIEGNGTVQQVVLQPGQPVLISGFDRAQEENEARRLGESLPLLLGGSDRVASEQQLTVIIVTAQVEEGV